MNRSPLQDGTMHIEYALDVLDVPLPPGPMPSRCVTFSHRFWLIMNETVDGLNLREMTASGGTLVKVLEGGGVVRVGGDVE